MSREKRITYLIVTLCAFASGFLTYGGLEFLMPSNETAHLNKGLFALVYGLLGGILISSLISTVMLSANFFSKRKLAFKIVSAVLWPITFICIFYAGVFTYIPYQIYNIVKIVNSSKKKATQETQIDCVIEELEVFDITSQENIAVEQKTEQP